jgi:hypothetical protein
MKFLRQLSAVCSVNVRDDLMRPINPLVAIAGAAGTAFVLVSILAVAEGLSGAMGGENSPDTALIVSRDASVEVSSVLSEEDRTAVENLLGERASRRDTISPELLRSMDTISRGGEAGSQVVARALGPEGIRLRPKFRLLAGRMFRRGTFEVIVGRRLARDFAGLSLGETVTGSVHEWKIVGIFADGGGLGESEVWSDLDSARMENGSRSDVTSLRVPITSRAEFQRRACVRERVAPPRANVEPRSSSVRGCPSPESVIWSKEMTNFVVKFPALDAADVATGPVPLKAGFRVPSCDLAELLDSMGVKLFIRERTLAQFVAWSIETGLLDAVHQLGP